MDMEIVDDNNDDVTDWDAAANVADAPAPTPAPYDIDGAAIADNAMKLNEVLTPPTPPVVTVTEPVTVGDGEPSAEEIAAAEALLARVRPNERDPDGPVSDKAIPIVLAEEPPAVTQHSRIMIGNVEVIATADKIEYIQRYLDGTTDQEKPPVVNVPPPVSGVIAQHISAEQEAGRRALARQQERSVSHPPLPKTLEELELEKPPVTIFRGGGGDAQQHLLRTAPVAGKGQGY